MSGLRRGGAVLVAAVEVFFLCGLAACSRRPLGSITLGLSTQAEEGQGPAVQPSSNSGLLTAGGDTLLIRQVELVVQGMEIAPADAGDCEASPEEHEEACPVLAPGATLLDLPLGSAPRIALTKLVPADRYSLLKFRIQTPDSLRDREFLLSHPRYHQGSVRLQGVFSRHGVHETVDFWLPFNEGEELAIEPPIGVSGDSTTSLTLRVSVGTWFLNAERTAIVDPGTAGPGQPYEYLVRDNIRTSLRALGGARPR